MLAWLISCMRGLRRSVWRFYVFSARPRIPGSLRRAVGLLYGTYVFWRLRPGVTRVLGPRYTRSQHHVDIDITWDCNLFCFQCNRSCRQAPTKEHMTVGQIRRFLNETLERNFHWARINLIGGEPTLHPQFDEILKLVLEYRDRHWPDTQVTITTNGFGPKVNGVLARLPAGIELINTRKTGPEQYFVPYNLAPSDAPEYARADFKNACSVARDCGLGLTPYGYYPCPVAGAVDRIFGLDLGRKSIPSPDDPMETELIRFCPLCGFFRLNYTTEAPPGPAMSPTWQRAYGAWRREPPLLSRYPEC